MTFHCQPQILLGLLYLGHICENAIDVLLAVPGNGQLAFIENPDYASVPGKYPVFQFNGDSKQKLLVEPGNYLGPVVRVYYIEVMTMQLII